MLTSVEVKDIRKTLTLLSTAGDRSWANKEIRFDAKLTMFLLEFKDNLLL